MNDQDRIAKLRHISRLNAEELEGWRWALRQGYRDKFDGEDEALLRRERELGITRKDTSK